MTDDTELRCAITRLVLRHGSLRAAGEAISVDHTYLHRLLHGEKAKPSDAVLAKLGIQRIVTYRRLCIKESNNG